MKVSGIDLKTALTPQQMVEELDKYVIGQTDAKHAVAVAFRNRWRRLNVKNSMLRKSIIPKNILLKGPTGTGKTEIARHLAELTESPFVRVTATEYTQKGYRGGELTDIFNDLYRESIRLHKRLGRKKPKTTKQKDDLPPWDIDVNDKDQLRSFVTSVLQQNTSQSKPSNANLRPWIESQGVVFIDEIDKLIARESGGSEMFKENVQRELLTLIEGTTVTTDEGPLDTSNLLFICAGSFHRTSVNKLIPELLGRLPLQVELSPLSQHDLQRILTEPQTSIIKQYQALLVTDGITLTFKPKVYPLLAKIAWEANHQLMDIGARRLHEVIELLLRNTLFQVNNGKKKENIVVDEVFVEREMQPLTTKLKPLENDN